jgi:hypothetical protein
LASIFGGWFCGWKWWPPRVIGRFSWCDPPKAGQLASLTKVVGSNPVHVEEYSIQHYVIKFVKDLWQVSGFLRVLRLKLTATI